MSLSRAQRADLQRQAERSFLHVEAAMVELARRKRRATRMARRLAPFAALLATAGLIRWLVRHRHDQRQRLIAAHPTVRVLAWPPRQTEPTFTMLIAALLHAWLHRVALGHSNPMPARQLGPARPR